MSIFKAFIDTLFFSRFRMMSQPAHSYRLKMDLLEMFESAALNKKAPVGAFFLQIDSTTSLNILNLLPHLLNQHLHLNRGIGNLRVNGF